MTMVVPTTGIWGTASVDGLNQDKNDRSGSWRAGGGLEVAFLRLTTFTCHSVTFCRPIQRCIRLTTFTRHLLSDSTTCHPTPSSLGAYESVPAVSITLDETITEDVLLMKVMGYL